MNSNNNLKMKKSGILFLGIILLFMVGCDNHNSHDQELIDRIEKLWLRSDSSVEDAVRETTLLKQEMSDGSEMVKMKYDLLNIRLRDKLYIIPSSDDSIRTVLDYFEKHGTVSDMARSHYYMLCVYRDLHDSPRAIVNGLKALDYAKSMDERDSLLLMHIYSNLSELFHSQLNMDEAIHMALEYQNLYPNDPWAMMDAASAFQEEEDTLNAMRYYVNAYNLMMKDSTMKTHLSCYYELLGVFSMNKDEQKSQRLYLRLRNIPETERPSNYDIALGLYHKEHNHVDSALYYFKHRYENADNWAGRCDAASQIMECYHKIGEYAKAADYAMKFRQANDSVITERQFELTRNAQAEYKYNRDRENEAQIRLDALKMQRWLLITVIVFIIALVGGYTLYIKKRRGFEKRIMKSLSSISQLRREMEEKEVAVRQIKEQLVQSNEQLDSKRTELTEMMKTMTEKQTEMTAMKEKLWNRELTVAELKTQLVETDNQISMLQYELSGKSKMNKELIKELVSKELTELNTDILEIFDKSTTHRVKLNETQWAGILANIDSKHPELKTMLEEKVPRLNVALLRTAYLMMAGLTNQQIESIMGVSRQTQWERAKKLEKYISDILPFRNG